jgi:transcriptional regulator with XRE-family HTH domain
MAKGSQRRAKRSSTTNELSTKSAGIPNVGMNGRVKEIRTTLGLSQAKFSTIIALSSGYIPRIETGQIAVNERLIKLICSSFNVNESYLRYGEGDMFQAEFQDDKFKNLVSLVKCLPPRYQDFLFGVLDMLVKMKDRE